MPVIKSNAMPTENVRGVEHGASISLILDCSAPGEGPRLHRHPYDETWVVVEGNLTFQAGDEQLDAAPGDIVLIPPGIPHKFINSGRTRANLVCIHANPTFDTEWLE
jgi:mannose-6-phosphate isomerase-like protein (cupin superfamily)